jgi:hypothetical protein
MPKFLKSDHTPHKPPRQGFIWRSLDDDFKLSAKRRQMGLSLNLRSPISVFNKERRRRRGKEEEKKLWVKRRIWMRLRRRR